MAVARVFGKADGIEVTFTNAGGDRWEAPAPPDEDGEYAVEIWAEDEAGNQSYMCKMIYAICGHQMVVSFEGNIGFQAFLALEREYSAGISTREMQAGLVERGYQVGRLCCGDH